MALLFIVMSFRFFIQISAKKPEGAAPVFTEPVQPVEVKEGRDAKLQCTVAAEPKPNVEWFKNGVRVKESWRLKIQSDGKAISLTIKDARASDQGEFKCVATNDAGSASCSATLTIKVVTKPEFKEKSKATEVMEGDTAQFDARVTGYPVPEVEWFRGTTKLKNDERIELKENRDNNLYSLVIGDAKREDAGMYKCVASNEAGKYAVSFV